ncbi:MAG: redoxin domain-containing protein [Gammaproteobacteria bacterium]|nr:redoxin domain-containing protein [Gammaproteobacteria bacterium]
MSKPNSLRILLPAGFVAAILAAVAYVWFSPSGVTPAPKVEMTQLDGGQKIDLASLHGRPVLVTFWATSCPGCIAEMPHLIKLYKELAPKGFQIIGVAMNYDKPNNVLAMQKAKAIPYPIVWDDVGKISKAFGTVTLTPTHFLIDPKGEIVQHKIGDIDINLLRARVLTMLSKQDA